MASHNEREQSEDISLDDMDIELPPVIENFLGKLRNDRRTLLKGKAYNDPAQLKAFIGQYLYPRFVEMIELLGTGLYESYQLAASNTNQLQRLHRYTREQLHQLGADVDDDGSLPGVSMEAIEEFQQAFYAVGAKLQDKLPNDRDMEKAWNRAAAALSDMVAELMGDSDRRDDDDRDDDDRDDDGSDDDRDDDDGSDKAKEPHPDEVDTKAEKKTPKKKPAAEETAPPAGDA